MERPYSICTIKDYIRAYPKETRCIQMTASGPEGQKYYEYFQGNEDRGYMSGALISRVYINGWTAKFEELNLGE